MNGHAEARAEGVALLAAAIEAIAAGTRRHLSLYVTRPEWDLWSAPAVIDALRGFAVARSHREVRLLFLEARGLARDHAALVALSQRLPSLVMLREADPDSAPPAPQAFVIGDHGDALLFDSGPRPAATRTGDAQRTRPLAERFEDAWMRARPLAEIRPLGI